MKRRRANAAGQTGRIVQVQWNTNQPTWTWTTATQVTPVPVYVTTPEPGPAPAYRQPIRAWKEASLVTSRTRPFTGVGWNDVRASYSADARAECHHHRFGLTSYPYAPPGHSPLAGHRAPHTDCTCGFYVARCATEYAIFAAGHTFAQAGDLRADASYRALVISVARVGAIEVELSGHVIEHPYGYRCERQRVIRYRVPRNCVYCAACLHPRYSPWLFVTHPAVFLDPDPSDVPAILIDRERRFVSAACLHCAETAQSADLSAISTHDVRDILGPVELDLADRPPEA